MIFFAKYHWEDASFCFDALVICIVACNDKHIAAWFRCTVAANLSWIHISLKTSSSLILGAVLLIQHDSSHPCLSFFIPPFCSTHSPFLRTILCLKAHEEESLQSVLMSSQDGSRGIWLQGHLLSLSSTLRSLIVTLKCITANMIIIINTAHLILLFCTIKMVFSLT